MLLTSLNDDTLIHILSFLEPFQLIFIRKTCRRLYILTRLHIVWANACVNFIIRPGYPFPNTALDLLPTDELERYTCHASHLAAKWLSSERNPKYKWFIDATVNTSVTDICFMPGSKGTLLFTLSKSVWSAITAWKLEPVIRANGAKEGASFQKYCEWSPRGAIAVFGGFILNSCLSAEAELAISVMNNGAQTIELLTLRQSNSGSLALHSITSIPSTFKPVALEDGILAMSDEAGETKILNWKTGAFAILRHDRDGQGIMQHDICHQVVFAYRSVLVVRARSIHLFPYPILKQAQEDVHCYAPIASHSFGWVDGVSVKMAGQPSVSPNPSQQQPLSILIRAETDDPWASNILTLELYSINPNPDYLPLEPSEPLDENTYDTITLPYIFPPVLTSRVGSLRGAVRCPNIVLGSLGTAVWIQPRDHSAAGLYWSTDDPATNYLNINESLVAVVFPGPLAPNAKAESDTEADGLVVEAESRIVCWNDRSSWTSLDYDESVGRIVLGSGFGQIVIVDM